MSPHYRGGYGLSEPRTYRIGEVAEQLNLKTHVLRFWEDEFPQIAPPRTGKGQRLYTENHIAQIRRIQHLLHEQGLTIAGAKRVLADEDQSGLETCDTPLADGYAFRDMLVNELLEIRKILTSPGAK